MDIRFTWEDLDPLLVMLAAKLDTQPHNITELHLSSGRLVVEWATDKSGRIVNRIDVAIPFKPRGL